MDQDDGEHVSAFLGRQPAEGRATDPGVHPVRPGASSACAAASIVAPVVITSSIRAMARRRAAGGDEAPRTLRRRSFHGSPA